MSEAQARLAVERDKLKQAIADQAALQGILPAEQLAAVLAVLQQNLQRVEAELSGTGSIAQGEGATAVTAAGGSTAIGRVEGNVYFGPPPADPAGALAIYRRVLCQSSGHLPMRGVDIGASDPTSAQRALELARVYVALDTTVQVPLTRKEKEARRDRDILARQQETRPMNALEAVTTNRRLVLLGDPGGGKSTFANHMAFCLASHALEPEANWPDHLPGWPPAETGLLPVLVFLRDFARQLPDPLPRQAEPRHLWAFITGRLEAQNLAFAAEPLHQHLEQGRALLLLDGLDEVPGAGQRLFVREAVAALMARYPRNRYLVTCRTLSYQPPAAPGEPDLRLPPDIPSFELAPFDQDKIDRFIAAWYAELARLGTVRPEDQAGLARQLQEAVRRPGLWKLAETPLLLTVMALVHTHKGRLPDARALLYEETVDILLWRWEQVKSGGQGELPPLRRLLQEAERTEVNLKKVLWSLAYEAHSQGSAGEPDRLADISELRLQKALAALKEHDFNWARQVIETMKLRAGLLIERMPETFTFPHRTFQEYLAGAHLASQGDFARQATLRAGEGVYWREVILLAVGRLVYLAGDTDKPLALAAELCPEQPLEAEPAWRNAWLAGEVLGEIGLKQVQDSALGRDLLARIRRRLAALLAGGQLTPRERAEAGDTLARLGDPRPEVMIVDQTQFCYIPPGPFWLGSPDKDRMAQSREKPLHQVDIPYGYWLARYPVTVAQFREFVEATGQQPGDEDSLRDPANRPVRWITWDEALAFCRWLTERWQQAGLLPPGWQVSLPNEPEWEKAARGGLQLPPKSFTTDPTSGFKEPTLRLQPNPLPQRHFPWGNEPDPERANYDDTGIGTTSAVGCFPGGAGPYGCEELAGNVWEWCLTKWENSYENYQNDNDLAGRDPRVVRGGAYDFNGDLVRCAAPNGYYPYYRYYNQGFRLVVSPFLPLASEPSDL